MKCRMAIAAIALSCLATLSFSQPAYITFNYYFCPAMEGDEPPMTGNPCWQGTPIADGRGSIDVYLYPDVFLGTLGTFNGEEIGCGAGYFGPYYPITRPGAGEQVYCIVTFEGSTYSTINHLYTTVVGDNAIETDSSWWTCSSENPGCEVKDEQSGSLLGGSKSTVPSGSSASTP